VCFRLIFFCISKLWLCRCFPFGCCFTTRCVVSDVFLILGRCRFFRLYEVYDRMICEWWNGRYVERVSLEVIGFISLHLPAGLTKALEFSVMVNCDSANSRNNHFPETSPENYRDTALLVVCCCLHVVFCRSTCGGWCLRGLVQASCKNLTSGQTSWLMFLGKVLTICWRILKEWTVEQVTVSSHTLCSSQFTIV
jgi:hypothetical protein